MSTVKGYPKSSGLILAKEKTDAVIITERHRRNYACIQIGNDIITSKIDAKLSYKQQMQYAFDKASTASMVLAKMSNVKGPRYTSRFLISKVVTSMRRQLSANKLRQSTRGQRSSSRERLPIDILAHKITNIYVIRRRESLPYHMWFLSITQMSEKLVDFQVSNSK